MICFSWLGARPTSPFPNPYREVENDFVGLMDEFVVWDHAISDARRTAVIQGESSLSPLVMSYWANRCILCNA